METYRLNSRLVENNNEYVIQTTNDVSLGTVSSEIFINGALAECIKFPHPEKIKPEEVLSLVQNTHGKKKKEIETLLNAVRHTLQSGTGEMMYQLGLAFFYKRFYAESLDLFRRALVMNPEYHEALNYTGQAELALGNVEAAIEAAQKAVAARPEYADYRNNLGEALLAGRQYKVAINEFERAIAVNLYYSDAYFNFGLSLLMWALDKQAGDAVANYLSKSCDYFNKAALINPDYKSAGFEKGLEALKNNDVRLGFSYLKQVRDDKKELHRRKCAPYYMKYALHPQWITENAVQDRIKFLQNELNKNPTYIDLYAELGRCYLEHGRLVWKKGIEQYKKTIEINPSLARLNSPLEEAEKALDLLNKVVKHFSD